MCVDETMMKWLMATLAGKKPDIDRAFARLTIFRRGGPGFMRGHTSSNHVHIACGTRQV
jgi:hypothetical protein